MATQSDAKTKAGTGVGMVVIMIWKPRGLISVREPSIFLKQRRAISGSHVKEGQRMPVWFVSFGRYQERGAGAFGFQPREILKLQARQRSC